MTSPLRIEPGFALEGARAGALVRLDPDRRPGRTGRALAAGLEGPALGGALAVSGRATPTGQGILRLDLSVRNTAGRPIAIERLFPLAIEPAEGGALRSGAGPCLLARPGPLARALRVGYANPVPPLPIGPGDREDRAVTAPLLLGLLPRAVTDMAFDPEAMPSSEPGRVTSAYFTVLRAEPGAPALAIGFGRFREQLGRVRVSFAPGASGLVAETSAEGRVLAPGEALSAEPLILASGRDPHDALARYAALAGAMSGARPRSLRYWCTWYAAPCDRIDERFVATSVAALAARRAPIEYAIVDDGYQRSIGDWLEPNERFPGGLAALAATIRAAGFKPGIWIAPFAVSRRSRVFRKHPDWVVRDEAGRPFAAGVLAGMGLPRTYFALDLTRAEVLEHLAATLRALCRAGFELFKIDFLTAGAVVGVRADRRKTRAEAYAAGMAALRRGAEDAPLLGAIAPFALNAGHVEAQRVGADVALGRPRFQTLLGRLLGDWTSPSIRNALPGMLALAALDGRFFANDGDCVVARGLDPRLAGALARANRLTCSVTAVGDDPRRGEDDALAVLASLGLDPAERPAARVLDLLERPIPGRLEVRPREGGAPAVSTFDWDALGSLPRPGRG